MTRCELYERYKELLPNPTKEEFDAIMDVLILGGIIEEI